MNNHSQILHDICKYALRYPYKIINSIVYIRKNGNIVWYNLTGCEDEFDIELSKLRKKMNTDNDANFKYQLREFLK